MYFTNRKYSNGKLVVSYFSLYYAILWIIRFFILVREETLSWNCCQIYTFLINLKKSYP